MIGRTFSFLLAFAEAEGAVAEPSGFGLLVQHIFAALVFSIIGVLAFGISLWIMNRLCPFPLRKELEEDQNTAVAIIIGAMIIGMAIIIASAIHG